jgi:hypothetical protein
MPESERSAVYVILAWVPLAAVLALSAYIMSKGGDTVKVMQYLMEHPYGNELGTVGTLFRLAAAVNIVTGIVFIPHLLKNPRAGARTLWIVGFIFVASIVLPIYWGKHLRAR